MECDRQGVRVFVVDSDERRAYEERQRTQTMQRAREALEKMQTRARCIVWAGNTRDSTTVQEVIEDLAKRFRFRRVIFVGDRGMVTESNLKLLRESDDYGFLMGMTRRRNPEAETLIDRVDEAKWIDGPMGHHGARKERAAADAGAGSGV